jgi:hypothetical protein
MRGSFQGCEPQTTGRVTDPWRSTRALPSRDKFSYSVAPCVVSAARFLLTRRRIHRSAAKSYGIECNKITRLGIGILVAVSIGKSGP